MQNIVEKLTHDEILEATQSSFNALLNDDALLKDLPGDVTTEEIESQIAVEHGKAITLFINREGEKELKVIVPQSSTVSNLKKAIKKSFESYQKRARIKVKISWKYIWQTYNLSYDSTVLDSDNSCIQDFGVTNKVILSFKKKRKIKAF